MFACESIYHCKVSLNYEMAENVLIFISYSSQIPRMLVNYKAAAKCVVQPVPSCSEETDELHMELRLISFMGLEGIWNFKPLEDVKPLPAHRWGCSGHGTPTYDGSRP